MRNHWMTTNNKTRMKMSRSMSWEMGLQKFQPIPESSDMFIKRDSLLKQDSLTDSSASLSEDEKEIPKSLIEEKEFNPKFYDNIEAPSELKELFQYITRFSPQRVSIDYKLKIFVPDFIPSVGDIDAFLKICSPPFISEDKKKPLAEHIRRLGLETLDEPCGEQSDRVLLQMKMRSIFTKPLETPSAIAKSPRDIDRWITEIQSLKANQSAQNVNSLKSQINIDSLMSEWPEEIEKMLDTVGFPSADLDCSLSRYIGIVCNMFDIPVQESNGQAGYIQALYNLFNLYLAVKQQANV
ncbi:intraflagellar transport protein 46 homolog isoform X2 [Toxorhynchites rutilus septentrionalis]|uniref:intraflagellar transport protein 46 homolog isoform X2 n=1 Tax=Toxorhynchites rutilus septentrionalis TaxID=329112 RepID=UPI00247887CB|nr:intraflagellar transport protein 46 homolog isoform X2 [Toxorhynchites rutilus septentrionalis]